VAAARRWNANDEGTWGSLPAGSAAPAPGRPWMDRRPRPRSAQTASKQGARPVAPDDVRPSSGGGTRRSARGEHPRRSGNHHLAEEHERHGQPPCRLVSSIHRTLSTARSRKQCVSRTRRSPGALHSLRGRPHLDPCGIAAFQELEQLAGDGSLQAPADVADALAFRSPASGVGASVRVVPQPCEHDGVQGPVQLPIARAVQPCLVICPDEAGMRLTPPGRQTRPPSGAAGGRPAHQHLRGADRPQPGQLQQPRRDRGVQAPVPGRIPAAAGSRPHPHGPRFGPAIRLPNR
jgi:hypothetical protein